MNRPRPLGLEPSFGYGDRLGLATPGHIDAHNLRGGGIKAIFAQQSVREIVRTKRSAGAVLAAAQRAVDEAGFSQGWGADADHIKKREDIAAFVECGYSLYTIDPSDYVSAEADELAVDELPSAYNAIREQLDWIDQYAGLESDLDGAASLAIDPVQLQRCAVKYGLAINYTVELAGMIAAACKLAGLDFEIEMSVDETERPTTLAEHYIIAKRLLDCGVNLVSLAPRYIGGFEKGIDYLGDPVAFEANVAAHAAIAKNLGPYKLSLHSGSDKLSIYPGFARATDGRFHVKTAGTSYLEALRVVADRDRGLFARVVNIARANFAAARATYHMSIELSDAPVPGQVSAAELAGAYLDQDAGRQIAHVAFGSVLTDPELGRDVARLLEVEADLYARHLRRHFARHLDALNQR